MTNITLSTFDIINGIYTSKNIPESNVYILPKSRIVVEAAVCVQEDNRIIGIMFFTKPLFTFGPMVVCPFPIEEFNNGVARACFHDMEQIMPDRDV